jgi:pimeloyl-ACP methyl ester carboxylesterase
LGPGQVAYTTEIATLSSYGYPVVAFDSTGCNLSEGKSMKGIYEYVRCAICATQFAKSRFPKSKIVLVGHSLGGYSALCAASACGVEKVVAISAPATPVKTFTHLVEGQTGKGFAKMVTPFLSLVNIFRFGIKGNTNAAKCASKSNFPVLLIQGKKDVVIDEKNSVYNLAQGSHIKKILREESGHNPYNTVQAEEKLSELSAAMVKSDTPKEFYESFDFALATEEESSLFSEIKTFILG